MTRQECWNCTKTKQESSSGEGAQDDPASKSPISKADSPRADWAKGMVTHKSERGELLASFTAEPGVDFFMHKTDGDDDDKHVPKFRKHRNAKLDPLAFVVAGKVDDSRLAKELEEASKDI
jgi:hypothetical protein